MSAAVLPAEAQLPALERLILTIAPGWAAGRASARAAIARSSALELLAQSAVRGYEAGAYSRRTQGWLPTTGSGSADTATYHSRLVARARDLAHNNPWMAKALAVVEDDVVGTGFAVTFHHKDAGLAEEAAARWAAWADSLEIDPEGLHDFSSLLGLSVRGMAECGDMFFRRRWRRAEDGLSVPMQVQLLEGEHLDSTKDQTGGPNTNEIVQGVEFDALGRRVAYWLYRQHPGDLHATSRESVRVAASEVIHLFRVERRGAVRGIPWGVAALMRLRDLHEYEDAALLHAKLSNMVVGTVKSDAQIKDFAPLNSAGKPVEPIEDMKPGMLQYLNPGEELTFTEPPRPNPNHGDYLRVGLLGVAAAFGMPYEAMTGDLRNTSFSSGRLGWLQWNRRVEATRWKIVVPRVCQPIVRWFLQALAVEDERFLQVTATWDPPHREMIDPTQEVASFEKAVRAGFMSRSEVLRSLGRNPDHVLEEIAAEQIAADNASVLFTTDPKNDLGRKPAGEPGRKPGEASNS